MTAFGHTALNLTLRLSKARSCLVPASSKPVMAENISADAFIIVVRTFRPFSVTFTALSTTAVLKITAVSPTDAIEVQARLD